MLSLRYNSIIEKMKRTFLAGLIALLVFLGFQSCASSGGGMYKNKDCFGQKTNNHKFQ